MIDDLVYKKINMYSVLGKQLKRLSKKTAKVYSLKLTTPKNVISIMFIDAYSHLTRASENLKLAWN